jgi:hypothetical protein
MLERVLRLNHDNRMGVRPRLSALTVLAVAIAVYMAATATVSPFIPDDSYISFRYAESVAAGKGLRFNAGDPPVEGYSNFLWVLSCALLRSRDLDLPDTAPSVGRFFGLLTLVVLWALWTGRNMGSVRMLTPLLLVATAGPLIVYAISGLETTMFAFLLVTLFWVYARVVEKRRVVDAVGFGIVGLLVALCRPEGVVAFPTLFAVMALAFRRETMEQSTKKTVITAATVFVVLYGAYTVWRVAYFGALLPTPFLSKSGVAVTDAWIANFRHDFLRHRYDFPQIGYYMVSLFALAAAGATFRRGRASVEVAALVLSLVYAAVYINFVDWMPGMRYYAALVPLLFVPVAQLWNRNETSLALTNRRVANTSYALVSVAALLTSLTVLVQLKHTVKRVEEGNQFCVRPLAEWIDTYTPPDWKLAMSDVGAVPYYSKRYTIDINPRSLADPHAARNGWSEDYFYSKDPDIVVLVSRGLYSPKMYAEHTVLMKGARFMRSYRFIGATRQSWHEDRSYWVYFRNDSPPLDDEALDRFPVGVGLVNRVER